MNSEQPNITTASNTQVVTENKAKEKLPLLEIPRSLMVLFMAILLFVAALYYGIINP